MTNMTNYEIPNGSNPYDDTIKDVATEEGKSGMRKLEQFHTRTIFYAAIFSLLIFFVGVVSGYKIPRDCSHHEDFAAIEELMIYQNSSIGCLITNDHVQMHYLVPHTKDDPNPFCPVCIKLQMINKSRERCEP